jgi:hypothetical protein
MTKATMNEMVEAVKAKAMENYENGWSFIIECYSDEDIAEQLEGCTTIAAALKEMKKRVKWNSDAESNCW